MSRAYEKRNVFDWGEYFLWLCEKIDIADRGDRFDYFCLAKALQDTEFVAKLDGDKNRISDGINLRVEFAEESNIFVDEVMNVPCSVLEVLVALCLRIERGITGEPGEDHPEKWFWQMIDNLGLGGCTDVSFDRALVDQNVNLWMERLYSPDGRGGIFPIRQPFGDQRNVELWVQMQQYIHENFVY